MMARLSSIIIIVLHIICQAPLMTGSLLDAIPTDLKQFYDFMTEFGKNYNNVAEQAKRFSIFKSNLETIEQLNNNKRDSAEYGVTRFSDLTLDEFKHKFLHKNISTPQAAARDSIIPETLLSLSPTRLMPRALFRASNGTRRFPKTGKHLLSWIQDNPYYPPVEDEGQSDLSTEFAIAGALSILYSIQQKQAINLSKQQYVDCCGIMIARTGQGYTESMFEYLKESYLAAEADYPFRKDGKREKCNNTAVAEGVAKLADFWSPKDLKRMADAFRKSPIMAGVMKEKLQHYKSGIITDCPNSEDTDYGVVIVEHGVEADRNGVNTPYYLLRTSWGPNYGILQGHVKVKSGTCGIERVVYAIKLKSKGTGGCLSGICRRLGFKKKT